MTGTQATRRSLLHSSAASVLFWVAVRPALADEGPVVRLDLAPDQRKYDPADENLRDAAFLLQKALNAEQVQVFTLHLFWPSMHLLRQMHS